jgi:hypothetical protein
VKQEKDGENQLHQSCEKQSITESRRKGMTYTIKRRKANWIGHILCRICFQKHIIEGKTEVTGRQGSRCKPPLDHLKELIL